MLPDEISGGGGKEGKEPKLTATEGSSCRIYRFYAYQSRLKHCS